ncbi:hypothetical protein WDW86_05185 [Bdellovibrionota bacterium FG-2]
MNGFGSVLILILPLLLAVNSHARSESKSSFTPSLGVTNLAYQETFKTDYVARVLTAKLQYQRQIFSPSIVLGASTYATALILSSNLPDTSVRFMGLNLRLGYAPVKSAGWSFGLFGGWYYNTMQVQDKTFGVRNLSGPQIFPTVKRQFGPNSYASAYLKFSPTLDNLSLMPLEDRELGAGLGWNLSFGKSKQASITFDASNLREYFAPVQVNLTTYSLSFGLGF